jgi:hypothetical protein
MKGIGKRIKLLAEQRFGSQVGLAKKINMDPQNLNRMIKSDKLSLPNIIRIVNSSPGLNIHWLFTGEGKMYIDENRIQVEEPITPYIRQKNLPKKILEAHEKVIEAQSEMLSAIMEEISAKKGERGRPCKISENETKKPVKSRPNVQSSESSEKLNH